MLGPKVFILKNCPLCATDNIVPIKHEQNLFPDGVREEVKQFHKSWITLMKCRECSFLFTKEIPIDENFFSARYDIEFDPAVEAENDFKKHILEQSFDLLKKHGTSGGDLLDIGSFAGILMRYAQTRGYNSHGIEVNPTMANYAAEVLKLNVFIGTFFDYPNDKNKFDVITLIDVLEHLLNPREMLEKCFELLKPGGHILIKVPHGKTQIWKQDVANFLGISKLGVFGGFGHINHFSPDSLGTVLKDIGFEINECIVADSERWPATNGKAKIKNAFRIFVTQVSEFIRKITGINLGLNITMLAKKPSK